MLLNTEIIRKTDAGYKRASEIDDGQQWFSDLKARMRKEKKIAEVVFLSPSRARALLNANPDNRKVTASTVEAYAKDIAQGRFAFNGQTIIVADTGELNDGQHRCEAVVLAGIGIETLLVAGVPRITRTTVDMGKTRTTGDFLHMHGIPYANHVASAAGVIYAYELGIVLGDKRGVAKSGGHFADPTQRPTKQQLLTFARANLEDIERAIRAVDIKKATAIATFSRFIGVLCILARRSKDWKAATEFITAILEGDNLKKGTPEYIVREKLIAERSTRLGPVAFVEIVVRGWNAKRSGKPLNRISVAGFIPDVAR